MISKDRVDGWVWSRLAEQAKADGQHLTMLIVGPGLGNISQRDVDKVKARMLELATDFAERASRAREREAKRRLARANIQQVPT